ncbi:ROK family protein [Streptococcus oralis]|nr:hypothetical protein H354_03514 [Streptococcus oralis subsp. tigurinus AZ_3a]
MAKIIDLKQENIHKVRSCFYQGGTWTKNQLSSQTGISLAGTTNILQILENDVNVASLGYCSIHPEFRTLALLYQPDTDFAGSGIIINKRLHRGRNGFAGEVGYLMNGYKPPNRQSRSNDFTFLLLNQITALTSVIAPDAIAYYCPSLQENIKISDTYLPKEFHPILERLTEIDPFILNGVQSIGKNKILEIKRRTI